MLTPQQRTLCQPGLKRLAHPVLPLARLAGMLFLTGPFADLESLLAELTEPVETAGIRYEQPGLELLPYLEAMRPFERLKHPRPPSRVIFAGDLQPVDPFTAIDSWVAQNVLTRELEEINSLLCGPCGCTLCCTGPDRGQQQEFFEIPLSAREAALFDLPRVDNDMSRATSAAADLPLIITDIPFYQRPAALYHWRQGWSMILPRLSICPNLDGASGGCRIYPSRPEVCRRPQIFPYMLERTPDHDREFDGRMLTAFLIRNKMLAIWDCPYVKQFQTEIGVYAQMCGMEPVFKENKA
ncbi:MAG: YkgJ family cysteine cluster protein [Deltaproteobacteria bacterium]|nr:YkgJ family cysteine cluster protein [Deltaproteobacteria bacterium]